MEDKEQQGFSWTLCFYVTGFSFLAFSFALKILEADHFSFFLKIGFAGIILGFLASLNKLTATKVVRQTHDN